MGLLSIFSKPTDAPREVNANDPVAQARVRARRRLIGAALLVGAGIIGFPLLFETQPRPIPVDLPIVIPRKEAVAPLTPPKPRPAPSAAADSAPSTAAASASTPPAVINETRADAGREVPPPKPTVKAEAKPAEVKPETKPEAKPAPKIEAKADAKPEAKADPKADDAARVKALLEGRDATSGRSVVQIGAYADAGAARDMRQRVEKLGLKTYTQVVETSEGKRIRVRVGPFATRDEAERTIAKLKSAGLSGSVLSL